MTWFLERDPPVITCDHCGLEWSMLPYVEKDSTIGDVVRDLIRDGWTVLDGRLNAPGGAYGVHACPDPLCEVAVRLHGRPQDQ